MLNEAAYMCSCLQEIKSVGAELSITPVIIRGEELKQKGLGGTVLTFNFSVKFLSLNNHIYFGVKLNAEKLCVSYCGC